jgi:hypothetical protein
MSGKNARYFKHLKLKKMDLLIHADFGYFNKITSRFLGAFVALRSFLCII